ncbi:MAG TPA: YrhK family protein [Gammaproteobacteria bacterium]|nr:YrhK family protein [Gammaproteobacteria bacterium]
MDENIKTPTDSGTVTITLGHEQLVIRQRYEAISIFNDFLIATWFLVGSVFFLFPTLKEAGVWLFIIGSAQFMGRPALRLAHRLHLRRLPASTWEM